MTSGHLENIPRLEATNCPLYAKELQPLVVTGYCLLNPLVLLGVSGLWVALSAADLGR